MFVNCLYSLGTIVWKTRSVQEYKNILRNGENLITLSQIRASTAKDVLDQLAKDFHL